MREERRVRDISRDRFDFDNDNDFDLVSDIEGDSDFDNKGDKDRREDGLILDKKMERDKRVNLVEEGASRYQECEEKSTILRASVMIGKI